MKMHQILTDRAAIRVACGPCDIVFEWENVISNKLNIPIRHHFTGCHAVGSLCYRLPKLARCFKPRRLSLAFDLDAINRFDENYESIVPCVIDFYLSKDVEFDRFYVNRDKHPVVLISSREAYEVLKSRNCPLNIRHWGLSLSDRYVLTEEVLREKRFDAAIVGRTSKMLEQYISRYQENHPGFDYLVRRFVPCGRGCRAYYVSARTGKVVCNADTRQQYMDLLRQIRVGLYSTPGIDGDRDVSYNQVTPRFLEYLVSGCHVLARYPKNPDTEFYELSSMTPNIESYEHFEVEMERALSTPVDVNRYRSYLAKHTTSARVAQLIEILKEI